MNILATLPSASHNGYAGFSSPAEIGVSNTKADRPLDGGFFSSANSVPRSGGVQRGCINARQFLCAGTPTALHPASIDWRQWGGFKQTHKEVTPMPTIATPTRHIHKTLSYLSPEKYAVLRYPMPFKRLPFIHVGKLGVNSYWAVPARGEYFGGYEVGRQMARALLKHLATEDTTESQLLLSNTLKALSDRLHDSIERHHCKDASPIDWPEEPSSLRGQQAGFTQVISDWLRAVLKLVDTSFDLVDEESITQSANNALKRTDAEVYLAADLADLKAANGGGA